VETIEVPVLAVADIGNQAPGRVEELLVAIFSGLHPSAIEPNPSHLMHCLPTESRSHFFQEPVLHVEINRPARLADPGTRSQIPIREVLLVNLRMRERHSGGTKGLRTEENTSLVSSISNLIQRVLPSRHRNDVGNSSLKLFVSSAELVVPFLGLGHPVPPWSAALPASRVPVREGVKGNPKGAEDQERSEYRMRFDAGVPVL
jgi:hypothetical protein